MGNWSWVRTYSFLPGPTREFDWQLAAASGIVTVHAPGGTDSGSAMAVAEDIQAAIHYLYPPGDVDLPIDRVNVYLVPPGYGVDEQHMSIGRRGRLSARFYLRHPGAGDPLVRRAYGAGTVAHELVHIQRALSGIDEGDKEESVAYLLEMCSVLTVIGQASPTFSQLASKAPRSKKEQELLTSARAGADLAMSLPPTVYAGTEPGNALLATCAEHWAASRPRATQEQ